MSVVRDEDAVTVHLHRHHDPSPDQEYYEFWNNVLDEFGLEEDGEITNIVY